MNKIKAQSVGEEVEDINVEIEGIKVEKVGKYGGFDRKDGVVFIRRIRIHCRPF